MANSKICSIDGCGKPSKQRGWCWAHHTRWRRHGDPCAGGPMYRPRVSNASRGEPLKFYENVVLKYQGNDCLLWPYARHNYGYGMLHTEGKLRLVHRLACEAIHGPAPTPTHEVAHSCGNGGEGCCNPKHIRWATRSENHSDKVEHGTHARGERSPLAKLDATEVGEIRALQGRLSHAEIAAIYGVSRTQVWRIINHHRWAHAQERC